MHLLSQIILVKRSTCCYLLASKQVAAAV